MTALQWTNVGLQHACVAHQRLLEIGCSLLHSRRQLPSIGNERSDFSSVPVVRLFCKTVYICICGSDTINFERGQLEEQHRFPSRQTHGRTLAYNKPHVRQTTFTWCARRDWIFRTHLTRSDGKGYGKPSADVEGPIACWRFCNIFITAGRSDDNNAGGDSSGEACHKDSIDFWVCFWVCFGLGVWMVALEVWCSKTRVNL